jgi:hypothetical protein
LLDFVTNLLKSKDSKGGKYNAILVLVDQFSKYVQYLPTTKTVSSQRVAKLLIRQCFLKIGLLDTLLSN